MQTLVSLSVKGQCEELCSLVAPILFARALKSRCFEIDGWLNVTTKRFQCPICKKWFGRKKAKSFSQVDTVLALISDIMRENRAQNLVQNANLVPQTPQQDRELGVVPHRTPQQDRELTIVPLQTPQSDRVLAVVPQRDSQSKVGGLLEEFAHFQEENPELVQLKDKEPYRSRQKPREEATEGSFRIKQQTPENSFLSHAFKRDRELGNLPSSRQSSQLDEEPAPKVSKLRLAADGSSKMMVT